MSVQLNRPAVGQSSVLGDARVYPASAALPAGALAEWLFDEGSGATVRDRVTGAYPINLTLPASQIYQWTGQGVDTSGGGMVQTPVIPGLRTVAMLYRTGRDQTGGFLISGGHASGAGLLQDTLYTAAGWEYHAVSNGSTITTPRANVLPSTRAGAWALNRGGWVLVMQEYPQTYTTVLGLGGRHSATTSRCGTIEIGYAAAFDRPLTDQEREALVQRVRSIVARRGIIVHAADAPAHAAGMLLVGDSNGAGSTANGALVASLNAWQQAQTYSATRMLLGDSATRPTPPAAVPAPGATVVGSATLYGPELGIASARQRDTYPPAYSAGLRLVKSANGSAYAVPSGNGSASASNSYHPVPGGSNASITLWHKAYADWIDMVQSEAMQGVGVVPWAACIMLGTNDSTIAGIGQIYKDSILALISAIRYDLGAPSLPIVLVQVRDDIPAGVPESRTAIRAAQASIAAADPRCVVVPTDHLPMGADGVHYQTAMYQLGIDIYKHARHLA